MGLVFEVDSDQELREKMESGKVIECIREYFEEQKAEAELPFSREHLSRANAIDYIEVSSYETSIDYQTYVYPGNRKLVDDFRELVLLAYDQVFSPEPEVQDPDARTVDLPDGSVVVDRYFHSMWERYLENTASEVRMVTDNPGRYEHSLSGIRHDHAYIGGAISYLFISGAIDVVEYGQLSDQAWSIYSSALDRIQEVF